MIRRLGFLLASVALFGLIQGLIEGIQNQTGGRAHSWSHEAFLVALLVTSGIVMTTGMTLLALRFRGAFRWVVAAFGIACILAVIILELRKEIGLWGATALYFTPQLLLLSFWKRGKRGKGERRLSEVGR